MNAQTKNFLTGTGAGAALSFLMILGMGGTLRLAIGITSASVLSCTLLHLGLSCLDD